MHEEVNKMLEHQPASVKVGRGHTAAGFYHDRYLKNRKGELNP